MSRKNYKWNVLLFTSRYEDYSYEDYCAFCDANDVAPCGEDSDDFYSWIADEIEMNWDDFQCELSHFAPYDAEVIVEGTLGLWYGKRTIEPTEFDCVLKAVQTCITPQTMLSYVTKRVSSLWMHATTMDAIRSQSAHETRGENCRTCPANTQLRTPTDEIV